MKPFRLLCTGDVHLGRRPSRVPPGDDTFTVNYVWEQFIDTAINRDVDAVVLTGDIVDAENKMYEAYGTLERGIRQLLTAGIDVVAVAGNHDYDTFPRLASAIENENFHLLGYGGQWEAIQVESTRGVDIQFVGWSFPEAAVTASPIDDFDVSLTDGPTVGVLHCDAGRSESKYAPVGRDDLARIDAAAWLLGHIHAPDRQLKENQLQLYPGSLQPLDPGEGGEHGCWEISVSDTGAVESQFVPLASIRYDRAKIDVTGLGEADVESEVLKTLRSELQDATEKWPELRHVAYRLVFEGRTQIHQALELQALDMVEQLQAEVDDAGATIEDYEMRTRPDHDLQALASGNDPTGVLAQLLIDLKADEANASDIDALLRETTKAVSTVHESSRYEPLQRDSQTREAPEREDVKSLLLKQGYRMLDKLQAGT